MTLRLPDRGRSRRLTAVDAYQFPASVRQRFTFEHPDLTPDQVRTVEDGTRQWFRLAARHPRVKLSMPSVAVDALWHEMVLHTRDYQEFCDQVLGRFLHHEPESSMSTEAAAAQRAQRLQDTFRLAQQDEGCAAHVLPLLFRVDREVAIRGGRRYLADCGGRGQCFEVADALCLTHLTGLGKRTRGMWKGPGAATPGVLDGGPVCTGGG
ncbi:MAG TPA: hypothetical protein VFH03_05370 [Actinoplanes sp.]|nr:hypothetical protein [Actinoplanes sp.]